MNWVWKPKIKLILVVSFNILIVEKNFKEIHHLKLGAWYQNESNAIGLTEQIMVFLVPFLCQKVKIEEKYLFFRCLLVTVLTSICQISKLFSSSRTFVMKNIDFFVAFVCLTSIPNSSSNLLWIHPQIRKKIDSLMIRRFPDWYLQNVVYLRIRIRIQVLLIHV